MSRVIATHAVGSMDTWLGGGDERAAMFKALQRVSDLPPPDGKQSCARL